MSAYSPFIVLHLHRRRKMLNEPLEYANKVYGRIVVAKGFITDFASIGALLYIAPLLYALLAGYGDKAATIHDWLYRGYGIVTATGTYYPTRKEADRIFYAALRDEGVARWRASFFYVGVRLFGRSSFVGRQNVFNAI